MEEFVLIASVKSVCDSSGYLKLELFSDFPERFAFLEKVTVTVFGVQKELYIEDVYASGKDICLKFRNFDSPDDTDFLIGKELYVPENEISELSEGIYYIHDLIGSKVVRNEEYFGLLEDVMQLPANDVYVIKNQAGEEVLIPAVSDYIERFDATEKILYLKPGENTIYDED